MAVDVLSYELPSLAVSPRISFSHDLNNSPSSSPPQDQVPRSDAFLTLDLDFDFDFCPISTAQPPHLSSADELFSGGKILPTQIKNPPPHHPQTPITTHPAEDTTTKKRLKEFLLKTEEEEQEEVEDEEILRHSNSSRSFWQFRRSASLNGGDNGGRRGLLRSLQALGRSNSTGSAPNHKRTETTLKKQGSKKQPVFATARSNSSGSKAYSYGYNNPSQKPPLKKSCSGNYYYYYPNNNNGNGGGVRLISPVLNISPNYFSKGSVNLFGFGSLFCKGKSKKKKK